MRDFRFFIIALAAALSATGVIFGALGAHALHDLLVSGRNLEAWNTAVLYQLVHGLALFCLGLRDRWETQTADRWICLSWTAGILLFSGSIYILALGGPRFLSPLTPLGGIAFVLGWLILLGSSIRSWLRSKTDPGA